jgi:alpha-glucosidase
MLVYQVYLRSFNDCSGDGVGDLKGLTTKLDYIASLGQIDYVWISPCFRSPMRDFGYDISNYLEIDSQFGSLEDFDELITEADKRGLRIMIDFVLAHTSSDHQWFQESRTSRDNPRADWYVWQDPKPDGTPPNNWLSELGGSAWQWEPMRQQYYLKHFLPEQPALNWYNAEVVGEMESTLRFWLDRGVKGVRLDALAYAHHDEAFRDNPFRSGALKERCSNPFFYQELEFSLGQRAALPSMKRLRTVADEYDDILFLAEFRTKEQAALYTAEGYIHTSYFFDFLTLGDITADKIRNLVSETSEQFPRKQFFFCMSNHDFARHVSRLSPQAESSQEFAKAIAAVMFLLPFNYCMYQGEELGLPKAKLTFDQIQDPYDRKMWPLGTHRDSARTPMPWDASKQHAGFSSAAKTWLPVVAEHQALSVSLQEEAPASALHYTRHLLEFRNKVIDLDCSIEFQDGADEVFSFSVKRHKKLVVECHVNFGSTEQLFQISDESAKQVVSDLSFSCKLGGQGVTLQRYGVIVFIGV